MIHNVYFWLKPGLSSEEVSTFEMELARLLTIGYLAHGFVGKPAPTEARPVTDHSFSYSLLLQFKTMQDHDFYQTDCPIHQRFVETCRTLWERVIVYDSAELI